MIRTLTPGLQVYLSMLQGTQLCPQGPIEIAKYVKNVKDQAQRDYACKWKDALKRFVEQVENKDVKKAFKIQYS